MLLHPGRMQLSRVRLYGGLAALVTLTGAGSCSENRPTTPEPAQRAPDVRLLVITDLDGYLEPCGCTSRPLGGIDRMAAKLATLRGEGVPTAVLMAGNLFFHGAPHGGDAERARDQEIFRAETLVEILNRLDVDAATPGALDFGFGTDTFTRLAGEADFPLLVAGAQLGDGDALTASTMLELGDTKVGVLGLAALESPEGDLPEQLEVQEADLRAAGRAGASALREAGADIVIALVHGDRRVARRVATGVDGVDFVIQGGLDQADANVPAVTDGAAIVHAGRQGQGLVVLDLFAGDGESWSDASAWSREAEREHLTERVESLERRIAEWEDDEDVEAADLQSQRRRLASLRAELEGLSADPAVEGRAFVARYDELPPEAERATPISQLMSALDRRVNEHNRELFADWTAEPAVEGQPRYLGSEACAGCHREPMQWWRAHAHGRAYETLETRAKNFNLSCVGCHVTGYLQPGGSTVTDVARLQDVGCESCHGPGSQHAADPTGASVNVIRDTPEQTCVRCHNQEHSDTFHYRTYLSMIQAPGHGLPSAESAGDD